MMNLVYIDDVVESFIKALKDDILKEDNFCKVSTVHTVKLGKIVETFEKFQGKPDKSIGAQYGR